MTATDERKMQNLRILLNRMDQIRTCCCSGPRIAMNFSASDIEMFGITWKKIQETKKNPYFFADIWDVRDVPDVS